MNTKRLNNAARILQEIFKLIPDEYTQDIEINVFESKQQYIEACSEHPELLSLADYSDAYFIDGTNIINILYYLPIFEGIGGDLHFMHAFLHEIRPLYQERHMGVNTKQYEEGGEYEQNKYEEDANKFAEDTLNSNYEKVCKIIGCAGFERNI